MGSDSSSSSEDESGGQKYTPREGFVKIDFHDDNEVALLQASADWDSIEDDSDVELWAIRVPPQVSRQDLANLTLTIPNSKSIASLGSFQASGESWDIRPALDAHEMSQLVPLIPRKDKLYMTSKRITRHLSIQQTFPTLPPAISDASKLFKPRPIKHVQPLNLIKHSWQPAGAAVEASEDQIDAEVDHVEEKLATKQKRKGDLESSPKKKRRKE